MANAALEILRKQMRDKFPQAHAVRADPALPDPALPVPQGKPFRVEAFPLGAISEVVPAGPVAGISLMIAGLLGEPEEVSPHPELVLVDGSDAFDPASFTGTACSKMLWVRCRSAMEMIKSADLLVHDGNVPLILLDSCGLPRRDLNALPSAAWWRLKQAVEKSGGRLVVLASSPLVPCASLRLSLSAGLSLHDFDCARDELLERLQAAPEKLRRVT
jgi:hypothetical protein